MLSKSLIAGGLLVGSAFARPAPGSKCSAGGGGTGPDCRFDSSNSPQCWDGKFDINTNCYADGPDTGVIREYWFDVAYANLSPDGVERQVVAINGSIPGPAITADWGDTVVVHVSNSLQDNGTSIHFHGVRQLLSAEDDGVSSITQCPIAPGDSLTYRWKASCYGSSWWHGHFGLQAWQGLAGPIVINGPASAPFDIDLGPVLVSDWYHDTLDEVWFRVADKAPPPPPDNGLINGLNVFNGGGSRFETTFTPGKVHRLRIVNTAVNTFFKVSVDGHKMTVIGNDFVAIKPFVTDEISIGNGQRYDVLIEADQPAGDYWLRATPQSSCGPVNGGDNILGVVRYDGSSTSDPTSTAYSSADSCDDMPAASLVPVVAIDVGSSSEEEDEVIGIAQPNGFFKWTLNNNSFLSNWTQPTLQQIIQGQSDFQPEQNVVSLPGKNEWVYFVIENPAIPVPHPIHLHGHDFFVLGQAENAQFDPSSSPLQLTNPPRRDVAMLPTQGYLVIGVITDNPGVWLLHCHIGWHQAAGFALQLVERADEIAATVDQNQLAQTCKNWDAFQTSSGITQFDAGM